MSFTIGTPVEASSSSTTVVCTVTGVPSLACIVCLVDWNNGGGAITVSSVSDGSSYTLQGSRLDNGSGRSSAIYLLASAGSGSHTITCTFVGGSGSAYMAAWYVNGVGTTDGFNQATNQFPGANTTFNCPSVTTTTAGDLVFGLVANGDNTCTFAVGASYTTLGLATNGYFGEYIVQGAAGAITPPLQETVNDPNNTFTLTFKALPTNFTLAASPGAFNLAGANAYSSYQMDVSPGVFSLSGQAVPFTTALLPATTITASPNDLPPGFAAGTPPGSIGQVGKGQSLLNAIAEIQTRYNASVINGSPNPALLVSLNTAQVAAVEYFMATYWVSADRILATIPIPANNKYAAYIAGVQAQIAARAAAVAAIVATGLPAITQGNQAPQYSVAYPLTQTPDTYWYQLQFQLVNFCMATGIIPASQILLVMTGAQTYPFNYVSNYTFYQSDIES